MKMINVDGIVDSISADQSKYINSLEIRLKTSEVDVKSKESEITSLRKQLDQFVYPLLSH
jgi:hypothetical protein